ncbi:histidine kinase [Cytophagaceae bacterium YF14B1]|uniref:Histidine kinase n=1 Tax=Xanthocytophaga flava TaxID=3048013 RepID=A0AAE3U732_9BACT|nr:histidine kinase [Xanthocytophaga flavus]MDJ1479254.1 histidine kinase [Xanthocytophaga flavus]
MKQLAYTKPKQHWFFKYKIHHILFWCGYQYVWWVIAIGNPIKAAESIFLTSFFPKYIFYVIVQTLAVCFNLYFLIPRYLEKNKLTEYIIYLALTIIGASLLIVPGYYLTAFLSHKTVADLFGNDKNCFYFFITNTFPSTLASMTLGMSIKLTKKWIQTERRQRLLEKEKLETELKFLKYQINPHFLFNTINSIFFLIHKNPHMASDSLAKFSELLRHQLYESNDKLISLDKEISYLKNFIELEKLRQNTQVELTIQADNSDIQDLGIAPFVLMTFVENAFKHVSKHTDQSNWIQIDLNLHQKELNIVIANSKSSDTSVQVVHYGGIGLENVKRRLDLLYPGQYTLDIQDETYCFTVKLQLQLSELIQQSAITPATVLTEL